MVDPLKKLATKIVQVRVFVLLRHWNHGTSTVEGVFVRKEDAEREIARINTGNTRTCGFGIEEHFVKGACDEIARAAGRI